MAAFAAVSRPWLTTSMWLGNGGFRFGFTNVSGVTFTVVGSTDLALPISNWPVLGTATESPPGSGQYQFTNRSATLSAQRFYRVIQATGP